MELYCYKAKVLRVVDGDTVDLLLSLGMDVHVKQRVRIAGIDAPETYGVKKESAEYEAGLETKNYLIDLIGDKEVLVKTIKDKKGKYGRYIAEIYVDDVSVSETLVKEGLAEAKDYD